MLSQLVTFKLSERLYALRVESVKRVARVVEITGLPKAPEIVLGVINLHGQIVPVLDIRRRFGLAKRELMLTDQLVVARTAKWTVAIRVDSVHGIIAKRHDDITQPETVLPGLEYVQGIAKLSDGLVVIHDLDRFLALDEEKQLESALTRS